MEPLSRATMDSPLGPITLEASAIGLRSSIFGEGIPVKGDGDAILESALAQYAEYFAGERTRFDLPLDPVGTDFQKRVWDELTRIPFGETISYATLAERIGNPKAVRAVGLANGKNRINIVVPCHRVIGSDGALRGYGGEVWRKEELLRLEGAGLFSSA